MRLHEAKRDLYRRLAKEQGYASRAAFKLIEANRKYKFINKGGKVVDFGAAPGGWMQVASDLVGPSGRVVGLDIDKIRVREKNSEFLALDVNDPGVPEKILGVLGGQADVVLSDLAPSVSGVWELDQARQIDLTLRILEVSQSVLRLRGDAFCKLFEGERSPEVRDELRRKFQTVHAFKPAASRSASSELYYYCAGWRGIKATPTSLG
jgi:23S rRNA (uridine2552-2'-O)-methyltransferase